MSQLMDLRDDYAKRNCVVQQHAEDLHAMQLLGTSLQTLVHKHAVELQHLSQQRQYLAQCAQTLLTSKQQQGPSPAPASPPPHPASPTSVGAAAVSPEQAVDVRRMAQQMAQLETAVSRQSRELETLGNERAHLESRSQELQLEVSTPQPTPPTHTPQLNSNIPCPTAYVVDANALHLFLHSYTTLCCCLLSTLSSSLTRTTLPFSAPNP
jgi:hypothetical protein